MIFSRFHCLCFFIFLHLHHLLVFYLVCFVLLPSGNPRKNNLLSGSVALSGGFKVKSSAKVPSWQDGKADEGNGEKLI